MNKRKKTYDLFKVIVPIILGVALFFSISINNSKYIISKINDNIKAMDLQANQNSLEYYNDDFWEWNTRTTTDDQAYNGKHITITNTDEKRAINFYGYGIISYKDYLYKEYEFAGEKIFRFKVDESKADYHTLDGAGFIFNAKRSNGKMSGDVLLYGEREITFYRIEDVDEQEFQTTPNKVLADYATESIISVNKSNAKIHNIEIKTSPTKAIVIDNDEEILNIDLDYSKRAGNDFGLLVSYKQHNCNIVTQIEFSQFDLDLKDYILPILTTNDIDEIIAGATYDLLDSSGNVVRQGTSDSNGIWNIHGLSDGDYTLVQKTTTKGHIIVRNNYKISITKEGKAYDTETKEEIDIYHVINERIKDVVIKTLHKQTKQPVENIQYSLCDKNGTLITQNNKPIVVTSDKNGEVNFSDYIELSPGTYYFKRTYAPDKYEPDTTIYSFAIDLQGNTIFGSTMPDGIIYVKEKTVVTPTPTPIPASTDNIASGVIPYTGESIIIVLLLFGFATISIIKIIEYKKYNLNK